MAPLSSRTMQRVYLALAVIGYLVTGVPMLMESARSGNILFWTKPPLTIDGLFGSLTTTAFTCSCISASEDSAPRASAENPHIPSVFSPTAGRSLAAELLYPWRLPYPWRLQ